MMSSQHSQHLEVEAGRLGIAVQPKQHGQFKARPNLKEKRKKKKQKTWHGGTHL